MAIDQGYVFTREQYGDLLVRRYFPERTGRESIVIRDWLRARGGDYDRLQFSVRIGTPAAIPFEALTGEQRMAWYALAKRIDVLAWQGDQPTIVEVKERMTPAVLGQLGVYRYLLLEELPGVREPILAAVGRTCDHDTLRILQANGITVYLYDAA